MTHKLEHFIQLSTVHLSQDTLRHFHDRNTSKWVVHGYEGDDGFFIHVDDEPENFNGEPQDLPGNVPADLWVCIMWAKEQGASYIRFKHGAERNLSLPCFEEAPHSWVSESALGLGDVEIQSPADALIDYQDRNPVAKATEADFAWTVMFEQGEALHFKTEDSASTFQRSWRKLVGRDPLTGEVS